MTDVLSDLEAQERRDVTEARARYWPFVAQLADSQAGQLDAEQTAALRADLRLLGTTAAQMRRDVTTLRELRDLAADDADPEKLARAAYTKAKQRAKEAEAAVTDAKAKLAAAEEEQRKAGWAVSGAVDAINDASQQKRQRVQRAGELASALTGRGMPLAMLPRLPGEAAAVPPKMARVRALEKCFARDRIVEAGDVIEVPEDQVGGPLVLVGSEADVPPAEEVYSKNNPPPWTTPGHLKRHGIRAPMIEGTRPQPVRGPTPAELERVDAIFGGAQEPEQEQDDQEVPE